MTEIHTVPVSERRLIHVVLVRTDGTVIEGRRREGSRVDDSTEAGM